MKRAPRLLRAASVAHCHGAVATFPQLLERRERYRALIERHKREAQAAVRLMQETVERKIAGASSSGPHEADGDAQPCLTSAARLPSFVSPS